MDAASPLFRSQDLLVRAGPAFGGDICFVTFSPFTHERTLDRSGFGETFLASRGFDAIHVVSRTNAWFAYREMADALAVIARAVAGYRRVVTYGSSMGGHAAIRFAERLGAVAAIAISPQYALGAPSARFETRFVHDRPPAHGVGLAGGTAPATVAPYVIYDPCDLDARHMALIARDYPRARAIALPHAGHPAGPYLDETGLLTGMIVDIAEERFDPAAFTTLARRRRRRSSQYLFTLARRLGPHHTAAKIALVRLAIAARDDATYRIYLATLLEIGGDLAAADEALDRAAAILPDHPVVLYAQASFLMRRRRFDAARPAIARLIAQAPQNPRFTELLAVANAASRLPAPSLPRDVARSLAARAAWAAWLGAVALRTRLDARLPALPRWHERSFNLARELRLIDEWRSRRRRRGRPNHG